MKRTQWRSLDRLLWIDGLAALIVGVLVFLLRQFLSELFDLPIWLLALQSWITLCYAGYSLSLARRTQRPRWMLRVLIVGNWAYALFCVGLLIWFFQSCSAFGVTYFLAEILFIGGLGMMEYNSMKDKQDRPSD